MLIESSFEFDMAVLKSSHYLNCPKHMLNHNLDCIYRQFHNELTRAIEEVAAYLKKYKIDNPKVKAKAFIEWRDSIKMAEFSALNVNAYLKLDKLPIQVQQRDNYINQWYKANTKEHWRFGMLISHQCPRFPYSHL